MVRLHASDGPCPYVPTGALLPARRPRSVRKEGWIPTTFAAKIGFRGRPLDRGPGTCLYLQDRRGFDSIHLGRPVSTCRSSNLEVPSA